MFTVVSLILVIPVLIFIWIKKRYRYWIDRGFPQTETSFPFGSFQGVGSKATYFETLDVYYKKFKGSTPVVGTYSFLKPNILIIEPDLIKNILTSDFIYFHDRAVFYNKVNDLLLPKTFLAVVSNPIFFFYNHAQKSDPMSANLLTLEGKEWKNRRVKLSPIFSSGKMKMMFEIIDSIGEKMVSIIDDNILNCQDVEVRNMVQRYTADNIGNVAFGIDCDCKIVFILFKTFSAFFKLLLLTGLNDPKSEFIKNGQMMFEYSALEMLLLVFKSDFPNIARKLGMRLTPKEPAEFFHRVFVNTLKNREDSGAYRNDLVSLLLGLRDNFTPTELASEGLLVFLAGFETSSTLMTFTLYELALNPEIQEKLREEIILGLEENEGKLTYDLLFGFKYLAMIVNESLRKYPPIADNDRRCCEDYRIPETDLVIPKGTVVEMSVMSLHRDPEYFPDPEKFDPERFSYENMRFIRPFTYLPFGEFFLF